MTYRPIAGLRLLLCLVAGLGGSIAHAGTFEIENDGDTDLYVATVIKYPLTVASNGKRWVGSGWYVVKPGQTYTVFSNPYGAYPTHVGYAKYDRKGNFGPINFQYKSYYTGNPYIVHEPGRSTMPVRDKPWKIETKDKSRVFATPPGWFTLRSNDYVYIDQNATYKLTVAPRLATPVTPFTAEVDPVSIGRSWVRDLRAVAGSPAPSFDDAESTLRAAARSGDATATANYGIYLAGRAKSDADKDKALEVLRRAAEDGDPVAMNNLGWALDRGWGVREDPSAAIEWYRKAADAGLPMGVVNYAAMLAGGRGAKADPSEAIRLLETAASDSPRAGYLSGWMRFFGRGVEQDRKSGLKRIVDAGRAGDLSAIRFLGDLFREGKHGYKKNLKTAFGWDLSAARKGRAESMHHVAKAYDHGKGVGKDEAAASEWYLKAAEAGHAPSMYLIAHRYSMGVGLKSDRERTFHWYRNAADAGYEAAYHHLADKYRRGLGTDKDPEAAFRWSLKAGEAGHTYSMVRVAEAYRDGEGVAANPRKTFAWAKRAMNENDRAGRLLVAWCYANGHGVRTSHRKAAEIWQEAADRGSAEAYYHLSLANEEKRGIDAGPAFTIRGLHRAARNYRPAREALADRGFDWREPLPKDLSKHINRQ